METIILSLGGSIIVPDKPDYFFLREFKNFIIKYLDRYRFVIVTGGGRTNSYYNLAASRVSNVSDEDQDWLGIMITRANGELLRVIFGDLAYECVIYDPNKDIKTDKKIIVAAGWKPGMSTDTDAVILADRFNAGQIINLTNITHVYDKDPKKYSDAKKLYKVSWEVYRKIVGDEWSPRMNSPFDPIASKKAQNLKLKVAVMKGTDIENLKNYLDSKNFEGTIIG